MRRGLWLRRGRSRCAGLLRNQRHTRGKATPEPPDTGTAGHHGGGPDPGLFVSLENGFHLFDRLVAPRLEGLGHHVGDAAPGHAAGEKRLHRDLVGRAEPGRGRSAAGSGLIGQIDAPEDRAVGRFEGQRGRAGPVERAKGHRRAVGPPQGVADGEPHVGLGELGQGRSVAQLHHGVHDRLRVHHYVDAVVRHPEQLVGLNDLQALVHEGGRVDRDLRAHAPRGMGQGVSHGDLRQAGLGGPAAKWSTRSREEEASHVVRSVDGGQALVDGAVLGVDRHDLGSRGAPGLLHHRRPGDQRLLVGQGQTFTRLQRGHGHREPSETDDGIEHHVRGAGGGHQARHSHQHLRTRRDTVTHHAIEGLVTDDHDVGAEHRRLRQEGLGRTVGGQRHHAEPLGLAEQHVYGLGADGAGGAQQADGAHQVTRDGTL